MRIEVQLCSRCRVGLQLSFLCHKSVHLCRVCPDFGRHVEGEGLFHTREFGFVL